MFLTTDNNRTQEELVGKLQLKPDEPLPLSCYCKKKKPPKTPSQIRSIALIFFLLACLYWLYKAYTNATGGLGHNSDHQADHHGGVRSRTKLKLISVFNRHGDRSPSDPLPPGDEFAKRPSFFWPNGLSNLTDSGKFRQFRVGLELRKRYEDLLDYNASHYLALSSPIFRCQESLEYTLRGLFDIEWPLSRGLKLIDEYNADIADYKDCLAFGSTIDGNSSTCHQHQYLILPSGAGSPLESKQIKIDTETVPTLSYTYLNACKYRLEHPTPVDRNLFNSPAIAQLKGLGRLKNILEEKYATGWKFEALGLHSTLSSEIRLARTRKTINYGRRNFEWVTQLVPEYEPTRITWFDLYEEVALLGYRDRIVGTADYIQLGPMISSMIISQQVVLGQLPIDNGKDSPNNRTFESASLYEGKKAVIYSTHDSIMQLLLHRLGFIRADEADYETRFSNNHEADDVEQLLAGLRMSKFGLSLVFELYEMDAGPNSSDAMKFPFVQVSLYNEEDGKHAPIDYRKLKLGELCGRLFREQNPNLAQADLDKLFYDQEEFPLDRDLSCPFELFKNVTSNYMMNSSQLNELCKTDIHLTHSGSQRSSQSLLLG